MDGLAVLIVFRAEIVLFNNGRTEAYQVGTAANASSLVCRSQVALRTGEAKKEPYLLFMLAPRNILKRGQS